MTPLYRASPADATLDVAISHVLLRAGTESLRLWTPPPALSFGRLDLLAPGHEQAIAAARAAGLTPVRRLAGGRAAPIGPGTVCLGWASPAREAPDLQRRYAVLAEIVVDALAGLGIAARIGELAGEWCAGSWSILVGATKVAGLAQRVIRAGAWAELVILVEASDEARGALDAVQRALGVEWAPDTFAGLSDAQPGISSEQVAEAVRASLAARWTVEDAELTPALWSEARDLRTDHAL
jgi:lipoate-protein ligase A